MAQIDKQPRLSFQQALTKLYISSGYSMPIGVFGGSGTAHAVRQLAYLVVNRSN